MTYSGTSCELVFSTKHQLNKHEESHWVEYKTKCDQCSYQGRNANSLLRHKSEKHSRKHDMYKSQQSNVSSRKQGYTKERSLDICWFFNNSGCKFGDQCRFDHDRAPDCHFQEKCRRTNCRYSHRGSELPFLQRGSVPAPKRRSTRNRY